MKNTKKRNLKRLSQRCFAVLLAVLMLFSCLSAGVSALSIGETVKVSGVKDWIGGYYYSFQGSDFGTHKYGQHAVTNASFENTLKKFTVTIQKQDSVTGEAQGDATLEGAVYGIYDGDKLVDTYTTDSNYSFTTKEYICGENWSLRELIPSEGYLLDETVHHIGAEPGNFTIEHNPISMTVTENPILGKIAIIKHNDNGDTQIETPEVDAEFEVYLKSAGSYAAAKDRERDLLVTDANGFDQTKDLPYGISANIRCRKSKPLLTVAQLSKIANPQFDIFQMSEIAYGYAGGLSEAQIAMYADPKFSHEQMEVIWDGFARFRLSEQQVSVYADPKFTAAQMTEVLRGYAAGLSDAQITEYADSELSAEQMQEIRENYALSEGLSRSEIELQAMFI